MDTTHSWTMAALVLMSLDPADEELGLNNGDEAVLLADAGVASRAVCSRIDVVVVGGVVCHIDAKGHASLGKLAPRA